MTLDQFLAEIRGNLPVVVGGTVTVLVLTYLAVQQARRRRVLDPSTLVPSTPAPQPGTGEHALAWAPPEQSYADRRGSVRREGAPVRVLLSSTSLRSGTNDGYVVDRSTGGLRIVMQSAVPPGSTLQIRAVNAPDTVGFVTVIVRSCRKQPDHFEVGTEFEKTPPWSVLLLFG
ncbi:PilZ domain-containing protein [bacterium]|nr:PilZ domain-containing protein [bacterium]